MNPHPPTLSNLSPAWQDLIRRMQRLNFGYFTNVCVENGEPKFDEHTGSVALYKFPGENAPRPESDLDDFALTAEACEFIEAVRKLRTKRIFKIQVRHGLPFQMEVDDL